MSTIRAFLFRRRACDPASKPPVSRPAERGASFFIRGPGRQLQTACCAEKAPLDPHFQDPLLPSVQAPRKHPPNQMQENVTEHILVGSGSVFPCSREVSFAREGPRGLDLRRFRLPAFYGLFTAWGHRLCVDNTCLANGGTAASWGCLGRVRGWPSSNEII